MLCHLGVIFETHYFSPLNKILIISFCRYPIFMQFHCVVFVTDVLQISSLIMGTVYIDNDIAISSTLPGKDKLPIFHKMRNIILQLTVIYFLRFLYMMEISSFQMLAVYGN